MKIYAKLFFTTKMKSKEAILDSNEKYMKLAFERL